jgi:hypothetical protein
MEVVLLLRNVGGVAPKASAPTNVAISSVLVTGSVTGYTSDTEGNFHRGALKITAYSSDIYVQWTSFGTTPSIATSSTQYDDVIPAGTSLLFSVGRSVDAYITSADSYSAKEFN